MEVYETPVCVFRGSCGEAAIAATTAASCQKHWKEVWASGWAVAWAVERMRIQHNQEFA